MDLMSERWLPAWLSKRKAGSTYSRPGLKSAVPERSQASSSGVRHRKKLVVCCDGTWNNEDRPDAPLTNVARISRCIQGIDDEGIPQIVFYQPGVGSGTSKLGNIVEGATGRGVAENIREAYSFLCHNYTTVEDEIFLIGFSRGAFTARSIAALINDVGILTKRGLKHLHEVYDKWQRQVRVCKKSEADQPTTKLSDYCKELESCKMLRPNVRIRVCAVWDTVGSLGVPVLAPFPQPAPRKLAFVNSTLCENIDFAFQALALNERRRHFPPTVWKALPSGSQQVLEQCWFLGNHSDVGGGNQDDAFANISLAWMLGRLKAHLTFDLTPLWDLRTSDGTSFVKRKVAVVSAKSTHIELVSKQVIIQDSMRGIYRFAGCRNRSPGRRSTIKAGSQAFERSTGFVKHETIHFTVRVLLGKGFAIPCEALKEGEASIRDGKAEWRFPASNKKAHNRARTLAEDNATDFELKLLDEWTTKGVLKQLREPTVLPDGGNQDWSLAPALRDSLKEARNPTIPWSKDMKIGPDLELIAR